MRLKASHAALIILLGVGAAACGGQQPPPEPAPVETAPAVNQDSIDAARAAEQRAREAAQLCADAEAAMASGNLDRARSLLERAQRDYAGTDCADMAGGMLEKIAAVETVRAQVYFEFDKSRITDEAAQVLQAKAEVLRNVTGVTITIEGHCDERGSIEYNLALGQRRADAAKAYLVNLGLPDSMFRTVTYGKERPVAQGTSEAAYQQNRRAEFVLPDTDAF